MREEYIKTLNELLGLSENAEVEFEGVTDRAIVGLMICKRLDRIASALEGMEAGQQDVNASLDNMDQNLESCISRGVRGDFLCITGNIRTDN